MEPDKAVIIIQNSGGHIFVHKRSPGKRLFPSRYALGAGGHVEPGEAPEEAARRELKEELGIDALPERLFTIRYESSELKHSLHVFFLRHDGEVEGCEEFQWSGWMDLKDVDRLASKGMLCPDTRMLYEKWKKCFSP
jgi:mutator protein MutT